MKHFLRILPACAFALFISVQSVHAAESDVTVRFRPHCESHTQCTEFTLYDQNTLITNGLKTGDTLDIDIVLKNPSGQRIQSVRSWLEYDPTILEGTDIRMGEAFPLVAPDEQNFAKSNGLIKLGASNVSGGIRDTEFVFAQVSFVVLAPATQTILLTFHNFAQLGQEGHTKALIIESGRTLNVLKTQPQDLRLYFGNDPPPTTLPPANTPPPPTTPPVISPAIPPPSATPPPRATPPANAAFGRLQPQGLRIMTEGDTVYLVWTPLADLSVVGYNIYYSTTSGRYIHRKTVSSGTNGVTIKGLSVGKRYFFALTGFNAVQQETDFSHEAAAIIGDPSSSTAPFSLTNNAGERTLPGNVLQGKKEHVPGGTGLPLSALLGIIFTAFISSFAFLRFRKARS